MIEANTMIEMSHKDFLPAISSFTSSLLSSLEKKTSFGLDSSYERKTIQRLSQLTEKINLLTEELEEAEAVEKSKEKEEEKAMFVKDVILQKMTELRANVDEAETLCSRSYWPVPTYGDLLFSVR